MQATGHLNATQLFPLSASHITRRSRRSRSLAGVSLQRCDSWSAAQTHTHTHTQYTYVSLNNGDTFWEMRRCPNVIECTYTNLDSTHFDILLTVHLSIFILVINQLDAQNLFYNRFISCLYMFRAPCAHRQEVKIVLYSFSYRHTCRWPSGAQSSPNLCTGLPPIGVMIPETV